MTDLDIVCKALDYLAEERLVDICNYFGVTVSEAEQLRDRAAAAGAEADPAGDDR